MKTLIASFVVLTTTSQPIGNEPSRDWLFHNKQPPAVVYITSGTYVHTFVDPFSIQRVSYSNKEHVVRVVVGGIAHKPYQSKQSQVGDRSYMEVMFECNKKYFVVFEYTQYRLNGAFVSSHKFNVGDDVNYVSEYNSPMERVQYYVCNYDKKKYS